MSIQHNADDEQTYNLTRRQAMKGIAAGTAAAGAASMGVQPSLAQDSDGYDGWDSTGDAVGASIASPGLGLVTATTQVYNWIAGDTNESAATEVRNDGSWDVQRYNRSFTREMALTSDLLEYAPDGIFSDAKLKGIEKLNAGTSQSEVESAMLSFAKEQMTNIEKNIITATNQGMQTLINYGKVCNDNGIPAGDVLGLPSTDDVVASFNGRSITTTTLLNGEQMDLIDANYQNDNGSGTFDQSTHIIEEDTYNVYSNAQYGRKVLMIKDGDGNLVPPVPVYTGSINAYGGSVKDDYTLDGKQGFSPAEARNRVVDIWNNSLKPDIQTWAANAYDAYASGDVQPADLLTATEIASTITEEEPANRAIAHLRSSGIGVDPDAPATIETTAEGGTVTVKEAILGSTGTSASIAVGDTVDPSTLSYDYTVGYSSGNVAVDWPHYVTTLDGGIITVNQTPSAGVTDWTGTPIKMVVQTSKDETASFDPYQYTDPGNPGNSFDVDLSDQLSDPIADVTKLTIFSAKSEPVTANKILQSQFTLTDGTKDSYDFSHDRTIHTTDNYVSAEEWDQRNQELQETIDELRDSGDSTTSGGGGSTNILDGLPSLPGLGTLESAVVVFLSIAGLNALSG